MSDRFPPGVDRRVIDGREVLATKGPKVSEERTSNGWREWDPTRSKVASMLELEMEIPLGAKKSVLYLGAAAGTTVSHVADICGPTYAIEFAPRPTRFLIEAARPRKNLIPLLKDARKPHTYAHIVEPVDVLVQDVATRGQATVALRNKKFLKPEGTLILAIKARSEDVVAEPSDVFDSVCSELEPAFEIRESTPIDRFHDDHLAVIADPQS